MDKSLLREINKDIVKLYNINICDINKLTKKSFIIKDEDEKEYIIKRTNKYVNEKFKSLKEFGINNIIYPIQNNRKQLVTNYNSDDYYVTEYIRNSQLINDIQVLNMYKELKNIHKATSIKKQLDQNKLRPKFEEITKQLDYKFMLIEDFIRSVEAKKLTYFSMPILSNYRYILDAKKELVRLQKLLISQIKDKISIDYSIVHNNPKLDHLINYNGNRYFTSIDNSKLGLSSLDIAKLYVETESLNLDFKSYIVDYYYNYENTFYYDYFRFLILFIYIKRLKINNLDYVSAENFINTSNSIKRYFEIFLDKQEQVSYEQQTDNQ